MGFIFAAGGLTSDLQLVTTIPHRGPVTAVLAKGKSSFEVVAPLKVPSSFMGLDRPRGLRFDLDHKGIVARRIGTKRIAWRFECSDAVLKGGNVFALKSGEIQALSPTGKPISKRLLMPKGMNWTSLDPNLRYALGFKSQPERPDECPLFMLDLKSNQLTKLPQSYDLGGHVYPQIISTSNSAIVYDAFFTMTIKQSQAQTAKWQDSNQSYYVKDTCLVGNNLYTLEENVDRLQRIVNATTGQVLWYPEKVNLLGFVRDSDSVIVFSHSHGNIYLHRISAKK